MLDEHSTEDVVYEAVEDVFAMDEDEYDDSTSFGPDGLDVDSLQVVEMVETLEYELDVQISDDDLEEIETVGDTIEVVRSVAR